MVLVTKHAKDDGPSGECGDAANSGLCKKGNDDEHCNSLSLYLTHGCRAVDTYCPCEPGSKIDPFVLAPTTNPKGGGRADGGATAPVRETKATSADPPSTGTLPGLISCIAICKRNSLKVRIQ